MRCSRNELTALMAKAAVGCGCELAVADELSRAACSLERLSYPGLALFLNALQARSESLAPRPAFSVPIESCLSSVMLASNGPSVFDVLLSGYNADDAALSLSSVDVPFLLAGMAVVRCAELPCCCKMIFSTGATAMISHNAVALTGNLPTQPCAAELTVLSPDQPVINSRMSTPETSALNVEDPLWQHCAELAALTYVPSSEASRLAGAGAGLTDND